MKTRRETLRLGLGALAATSLAEAEPMAPPLASRFVDNHTHFFDPTRPQGVPWPGKGTPLDHPAYPKDWLAVASRLGVRETVAIECSKWPQDNDWMLNLATKEKSILGFIGRLQPGTPDFARELKRLAANPLFRGIRVDSDDLRNNIGSPDFAASTKLLADLDLSLEISGLNDLEQVAAFADKVSGVQIVLGHVGSPGDPKALRPGWKDGIHTLAKRRNVVTKVSALVEYPRPDNSKPPADPAYYLPVLNHVWDEFGDDRLLFGSDWPVVESSASYEVLFKIVAEFFKAKGSEACEKFFWKNSQATYKWTDRK